MTASVLLIRHAAHGDLGERLSGRGPAPGLTETGRGQALAMATMLRDEPIAALHASPRARALETAAALADAAGLEFDTVAALDEVDFGAWTGCRYEELDGQPDWDRWNAERASARTPGGESMAEAADRALDHVRDTARSHPGQTVAMVSHCDVIRGVLARAMGLSLDKILNFDVDPASVSRLAVGDWGERVVSINERAAA
ncbi:histidine phosphatase family protein [Sphingomonas ginkgonis]|uniref:histidine phosphatase family protein n=1 Tax=Sphingomonas ginkgonis TaxID=2315330 RepID=UPI00163AC719|nr:histidine phosphatase family protein [Sphingomonas ginkgonis]